jgi:hypothetical protein
MYACMHAFIIVRPYQRAHQEGKLTDIKFSFLQQGELVVSSRITCARGSNY